MASIARHVSSGLDALSGRPDWRASRRNPSRAAEADDILARATAAAGLASLVALPPLLLASVLLSTPFAIPAMVGVGYVPLARAIRSGDGVRGNLLGVIVIGALVTWLTVHLALGGGASVMGLAAAMLAPLTAAAPAVMQGILSRANTARRPSSDLREGALRRLACLEELDPAAAVLMATQDGSVLAASREARRLFRLLPDAFEYDIASFLEPDQCSALISEMERVRCGEGREIEVKTDDRMLKTGLSRCDDGTVAMRFRATVAAEEKPTAKAPASPKARGEAPALPTCDVAQALTFVLRHAEATAHARAVGLSFDSEASVAASCDERQARRILHSVIDAAIAECWASGHVHVCLRRVRSVVLVRVTCNRNTLPAGSATAARPAGDAALNAMVEAAGGTLLVDRAGGEGILSVRLPGAVSAGEMPERSHAA